MVYLVWTGNYIDNFEAVKQKYSSSIIWKDPAFIQFTDTYKKFKRQFINDTTRIALNSVKSSVPVHFRGGGTLRNQHIESNINDNSKTFGKIWVDDNTHRPPYAFEQFFLVRKKQEGGTYQFSRPSASSLADLLETSTEWKRTADSDPEPGYSIIRKKTPTRGWVEAAEFEANKNIQQFLKTDYDFQEYSSAIAFASVAKQAAAAQQEKVRFTGRPSAAPPSYFTVRTGLTIKGPSPEEVSGVSGSTGYLKPVSERADRATIRRALEAEEKRTSYQSYKGKPVPIRDIVLRYTGDKRPTLYDQYKEQFGE